MLEIIAFTFIIVFLLAILSIRRKCDYCKDKSLLTGKAFDKVMCKKCIDSGGRR